MDSRKEEYCTHNDSTRVEKGTINYGLYSIEKNQLYTRYSSLFMIKSDSRQIKCIGKRQRNAQFSDQKRNCKFFGGKK